MAEQDALDIHEKLEKFITRHKYTHNEQSKLYDNLNFYFFTIPLLVLQLCSAILPSVTKNYTAHGHGKYGGEYIKMLLMTFLAATSAALLAAQAKLKFVEAAEISRQAAKLFQFWEKENKQYMLLTAINLNNGVKNDAIAIKQARKFMRAIRKEGRQMMTKVPVPSEIVNNQIKTMAEHYDTAFTHNFVFSDWSDIKQIRDTFNAELSEIDDELEKPAPGVGGWLASKITKPNPPKPKPKKMNWVAMRRRLAEMKKEQQVINEMKRRAAEESDKATEESGSDVQRRDATVVSPVRSVIAAPKLKRTNRIYSTAASSIPTESDNPDKEPVLLINRSAKVLQVDNEVLESLQSRGCSFKDRTVSSPTASYTALPPSRGTTPEYGIRLHEKMDPLGAEPTITKDNSEDTVLLYSTSITKSVGTKFPAGTEEDVEVIVLPKATPVATVLDESSEQSKPKPKNPLRRFGSLPSLVKRPGTLGFGTPRKNSIVQFTPEAEVFGMETMAEKMRKGADKLRAAKPDLKITSKLGSVSANLKKRANKIGTAAKSKVGNADTIPKPKHTLQRRHTHSGRSVDMNSEKEVKTEMRKRALERTASNRKELLKSTAVTQILDIEELMEAPLNVCAIYLSFYTDYDTQRALYSNQQQIYEHDDSLYFMLPLLLLQIINAILPTALMYNKKLLDVLVTTIAAFSSLLLAIRQKLAWNEKSEQFRQVAGIYYTLREEAKMYGIEAESNFQTKRETICNLVNFIQDAGKLELRAASQCSIPAFGVEDKLTRRMEEEAKTDKWKKLDRFFAMSGEPEGSGNTALDEIVDDDALLSV